MASTPRQGLLRQNSSWQRVDWICEVYWAEDNPRYVDGAKAWSSKDNHVCQKHVALADLEVCPKVCRWHLFASVACFSWSLKPRRRCLTRTCTSKCLLSTTSSPAQNLSQHVPDPFSERSSNGSNVFLGQGGQDVHASLLSSAFREHRAHTVRCRPDPEEEE